MNITIDEEKMEDVEVNTGSYLPMITIGSRDYYLAESTEMAGEAARQYWKELVENDPKEFTCMVGEETLCAWALGNYGGPGSTQVQSLEEWLDLWLDTPEEEFAGYDGTELEASEADEELIGELGFTPTVAYRHN
jgi:hypothetical protein